MTWAEQVKERDGMKCVMCGKTDHLQAHHIKPGFLYPEYRHDIDNGVTLCKDCHQNCHYGHFAGFALKFVNGINPDPEGRMEAYVQKRKEEEEKRGMVHVVWGTNKENGGIVFEAAQAAGQKPNTYIAEAVYRRLIEDGFNPDRELFLPSWKE